VEGLIWSTWWMVTCTWMNLRVVLVVMSATQTTSSPSPCV
jgi:hypothetical protein